MNLLSRARGVVEQVNCLRPDGVGEDAILTSLARFDVVASIALVGATGVRDDRVFYPNFAQFRQDRIQPMVERLLEDDAMRRELFPGSDGQLAEAVATIGMLAHEVGLRFDGFESWAHTPVGAFLEEHLPPASERPRRDF